MADDDRNQARAGPSQLDLDGTLLRVALLAGFGSDARGLARRLAAVTGAGSARSCLEAGAPVQFTVDAPGEPVLRVGLRLGTDVHSGLYGLVPMTAQRQLAHWLETLPADTPDSLGTWLFWSTSRQSIYVDVRDRSAGSALARVRDALTPARRDALDRLRESMPGALPWAIRIEANGARLSRLHVHWLLARHAPVSKIVHAMLPGAWPQVIDVLGQLLRRPGESGRWVVATPLDAERPRALRIGNTGWALVGEDDRKQRAIGALMTRMGGPREYAEALWSLCRGAASPEWRIGRACEIKVTAASVRARLFLVPQVQRTTAGTSSSFPVTS